MIEWGTGATKVQVACLTRLDDQQVEVRLARRRTAGLPETVILDEPSAMEYARLRKKAMAADDEINAKYPEPPKIPDEIDGETDVERMQRRIAYNKVLADWIDDRHNYRTDEDHPVFAAVIVDAVNMLATPTLPHPVTLADLTPETFKVQPLQGLLEVWESPLGGAVSPVETTPTSPTPTPDAPPPAPIVSNDAPNNDAPAEAASPELPRSSLPGGEPSPPSPPPSSTP